VRPRLASLLALSTVASIAIACSGGGDSGGSGSGGGSGEAPRHHGLTEEEAAQTVAKIGDHTITVGEVAEEIANKGPFLRSRYNSPERRRELLDQLVRFELLAQEADTRGFDEAPEVRRTREQIMIRRFLKQEYEDRIQLTDITDDEVRAYYEAHPDEFHQPEQVRASQILFAREADARRVLAQILASPTDVRLFRQLAEQYDTDPATHDRFGDLGFFSRPEARREGEPEVPPELANAAFALETIGQVAPELVHSARGWHIVKLTGRRAALERSLDEASRPIRHRLWRERREHEIESLVDRLTSEADVEEHLDLLSQIHIDVPEGAFPTDATAPGPVIAPPTGAAPIPQMPTVPGGAH
jgi:peptidyl-prolyl cis-trans isomerase C